MNYWLGLLISLALGFLGVNILRARNRIDPALHLIASLGLGMALSAHIVFYSLFTVGQYNLAFIVVAHTVIFVILLAANILVFQKSEEPLLPHLPRRWNALIFRQKKEGVPVGIPPHGAPPTDKSIWLGCGILALLLIPLWREANFYPFGGWDAWACWTLKANIIFLGDDQWKNMLDPVMWRSNNQYPFLLPLVNAWGWSFYGGPSPSVPMLNTVLFPLLTAMLMFLSLQRLTGKIQSVIPALVLFTIPFVNTLSISQYSDIVLAFYLLGSFVFLVAARDEKNMGLAILAGCFCGIMSFTKTEGTAASILIAGLAIPYLWKRKDTQPLLWPYLGAVAVSSLPTILFQLFWAPANASFVNGLTSVDSPVTFLRLKIIFMFLCVEVLSPKWNGLWIFLACGLLLSKLRGFKNGIRIVPVFLVLYLGSALGYYLINTHYEIIWWLQMTLNRILYTILPTVVWWVFYSLWLPAAKK